MWNYVQGARKHRVKNICTKDSSLTAYLQIHEHCAYHFDPKMFKMTIEHPNPRVTQCIITRLDGNAVTSGGPSSQFLTHASGKITLM